MYSPSNAAFIFCTCIDTQNGRQRDGSFHNVAVTLLFYVSCFWCFPVVLFEILLLQFCPSVDSIFRKIIRTALVLFSVGRTGHFTNSEKFCKLKSRSGAIQWHRMTVKFGYNGIYEFVCWCFWILKLIGAQTASLGARSKTTVGPTSFLSNGSQKLPPN